MSFQLEALVISAIVCGVVAVHINHCVERGKQNHCNSITWG